MIMEVLKKGIEEKWDFDHWVSGYSGAGFGAADIDKAKRASWANARTNPNASAIDGMKNILELNKATGSLDESIDLLPLFSRAEMAMQSVKAEGLHSKFTGGNQILNLAKGLEEMGYTTKGNTPEERQANVELATNELIKTMVASRGLFDGNKLFAMTNNSGGAAQNWDLRFGTTIAPIIGDIMNHSKLGNADYMSLKSFQGGHITPDAVAALVKYHLATTGEGGDAFQDQKGNWHLKANSNFAKGMESNLFDWSGGVLNKLKANGYDINDQEFMNGVVNEIGSNKSNSMLMRAVLEPGTRRQIQKEIELRDKVPNDVAGVLQGNDPVLKIDAFHKKLEDFYTALGDGIAGPAIRGLTGLTAGINSLSQAMEAHPELTKNGAVAAGAAGLGLFGYGAGRMLGIFGGGGGAGAAGGGALSGMLGRIPQLLALGAAAEWASSTNSLAIPKRDGLGGALEFLDPGLADRLLGKQGGASASSALKLPDLDPDKSNAGLDAMRNGLFHKDSFVMGGGANDNAIDMLAQGVFRGLTLYANGGAGGTGGGGIINASYGGGGSSFGGGLSPLMRGAGGGGSAPGGLSALGHGAVTGSILSRGQDAMAHLMSIGVSREAAAAIVGNAQQESSVTGHGPAGDHGTAHGMFQWRFDRFSALQRFAAARGKPWQDEHTELEFMVDEAKKRGNAGWLTGHDVYAANQGMQRFEQYGESADHGNFRTRLGNAQMWLGRGAAPTVAAPKPRVTPGAPAAGGQQAMNVIVNHTTNLDGKTIAKGSTKHAVKMIAQAMAHPTTTGGPAGRTHYTHAGTPLTDAA